MIRKALLPLLLLTSACQSATAPSVSNSASPAPEPSAPPTASPAGSDCNPNSSEIKLTVYSNLYEQNFDYRLEESDKRQPLPQASVKAGGKVVTANAKGEITIPRPEPVPEVLDPGQPTQQVRTLEVSAPGHVTLVQKFWNDSLCAHNFAALSPLSAAEQAGTELKEKVYAFNSAGSKLDALHRDQDTGLYYGFISTQAALDTLAAGLDSQYGRNPSAQLAELAMAIKAGKTIALLSDGTQGLGNPWNLIDRVTLSGKTAVMASHVGAIVQDPKPLGPIGDRFSVLIEAAVLPAGVDTLRFEVLPYNDTLKHKTTLQVAASAAQVKSAQ